jgi:coenzyme F420-reducing hydrogenase gamma subunit
VLQSKNVIDQMDVAFVEGAIASPEQEAKLLDIRSKATKLVAIGACANMGMPSCQRNQFPPEVEEQIHFLLERFHYGEKAKKLDELVTVDARVNGCPMQEEVFIKVLNEMLVEFGIIEPKPVAEGAA